MKKIDWAGVEFHPSCLFAGYLRRVEWFSSPKETCLFMSIYDEVEHHVKNEQGDAINFLIITEEDNEDVFWFTQ